MQLKKMVFTITAFFLLAATLSLAPKAALAKGPAAGTDCMPPGQAKKMPVQHTVNDVKNKYADSKKINKQKKGEKTTPLKGPALEREKHPSVKGLKNAYRNHCRNGAPEWLREKFRQKIINRGGTVDDIDEINEKEYTIALEGDASINLKSGQSAKITFLVEDSGAKAANLPGAYKIKLQVTDAKNVLTAPRDGDKVGMSGAKGATEAVTVTAGKKNKGTATIKAVLYNDRGKAVDSETIKVTVGEAAATTGSLTPEDSDLTFTSHGDNGPAHVARTGERISLDYRITDQDGDPIKAAEDTGILWTIKNTGENNIYVYDVENAPVTIKSGQKKEFTEEISSGNSRADISILAHDVTEAEISARIEDTAGSLAVTDIFYYDPDHELFSHSDKTITGTVKAFANSNDGTQILLYDGDDYLCISAKFETVIIGSNGRDISDAGNESGVEEYLKEYMEYNMQVKIWLDENEEDDPRDEDQIKLYLN